MTDRLFTIFERELHLSCGGRPCRMYLTIKGPKLPLSTFWNSSVFKLSQGSYSNKNNSCKIDKVIYCTLLASLRNVLCSLLGSSVYVE